MFFFSFGILVHHTRLQLFRTIQKKFKKKVFSLHPTVQVTYTASTNKLICVHPGDPSLCPLCPFIAYGEGKAAIVTLAKHIATQANGIVPSVSWRCKICDYVAVGTALRSHLRQHEVAIAQITPASGAAAPAPAGGNGKRVLRSTSTQPRGTGRA